MPALSIGARVMEEAQTSFRCLYCGTTYRVVRFTETDQPHDEKVFCLHCLRRLPHSAGGFTLKYLLIAQPHELAGE
jgi:ribosomal protein S27E